MTELHHLQIVLKTMCINIGSYDARAQTHAMHVRDAVRERAPSTKEKRVNGVIAVTSVTISTLKYLVLCTLGIDFSVYFVYNVYRLEA